MFNKAILIGRLGRDTEPRYMADGKRGVLNFSIATSNRWQDRDGNWQETTQWHNIVYWSKNPGPISERLKKGALVMVEGEIRYRKWEDKDGKVHDITEINARRVLTLEKRDRVESAAGNREEEIPNAAQQESGSPQTPSETEDDLPF